MGECWKAKSADGLEELLLDRRCQHALYWLQAHEGPLTLADLAEEVAVRELGMPLTEISATDVKEIYMSLYYTQIPRLEGEGLVRYDQETDTVARRVERERLVTIVETSRKSKC